MSKDARRRSRPQIGFERGARRGSFFALLIGLDRGAAKEALSGFLDGKALSASQTEFVNLIVDHLTEHGVMEVAALYASPFTDIAPRGRTVSFRRHNSRS